MQGTHKLDPPDEPKSSRSASPSASRLRRAGILVSRVTWWVICLGVLGIFVRGVPELYQLVFSNSVPAAYQSFSQAVSAGLAYGWYTPTSLAILVTVTGFLTLLIYFSVGAIILHRTAGAGFPLFVAYLLLTLGTALNADLMLASQPLAVASTGIEVLGNIGFAALLVFFYLFPNGRVIPRWMAIPILVYLLFALPEAIGISWAPNPPILILAAVPVLGLASQGYRYMRISSLEERQQTKWVLLALSVILLIGIVGILAGPDREGLTYIPATISFWFLPISVGLAISKYRLWDVDGLISRALVYGILTTVLAGIFSASIAFVGKASEQLLGTDSKAAAAAISAVLVAVLFQPLRDRLEIAINRRFFSTQEKLAAGLVEAQPGFWEFIDLEDLLAAALEQIASAMGTKSAAMYLHSSDQHFQPSRAHGLGDTNPIEVSVSAQDMAAFSKKRAVPAAQASFAALVPILLPRPSGPELIAVLALGPRANGRGYSGYDLKSLVEFGESLATAIYAVNAREASKM